MQMELELVDTEENLEWFLDAIGVHIQAGQVPLELAHNCFKRSLSR
jgi:hypothetical protein